MSDGLDDDPPMTPEEMKAFIKEPRRRTRDLLTRSEANLRELNPDEEPSRS